MAEEMRQLEDDNKRGAVLAGRLGDIAEIGVLPEDGAPLAILDAPVSLCGDWMYDFFNALLLIGCLSCAYSYSRLPGSTLNHAIQSNALQIPLRKMGYGGEKTWGDFGAL